MVREVSELPMVLTQREVGEVLGISRNRAYEVMHSADFPTFRVGKMLRVSKTDFLLWIDQQRGN